MKNFQHSRTLLTALLLFSISGIILQIGAVNTSYAQIGAQSTTATSAHGRQGGVPPGLLIAWAHSNMSILARTVTQAIFLNGAHGVELTEIAINASSNGQLIRNVAFNESVAQIEFDHDGAVELSANSSAKPTAIFADDMELAEAQSSSGLNANSNAWVYSQNNHTLTVFADPSSVTIFYGSTPTPVPEFPLAYAFALIGALAATLFITRKSTRTVPR